MATPPFLAAAIDQLNQPPPPTLRDILSAYKDRGDGDKAMLMTLLQAKTAEDERLASLASLHRTVLDVYYKYPSSSSSSSSSHQHRPHDYHYHAHPNYRSHPYNRKRPRYSHSRSPSPPPDSDQCRFSSKYSPRTQTSMTIDSLLSSSSSATSCTTKADLDEDHTDRRPHITSDSDRRGRSSSSLSPPPPRSHLPPLPGR